MWPTGPGTGFAFVHNHIVMQLQIPPQEPKFPVKDYFRTIEDVENYMSGDYIQCLLCGKIFKKLEPHIRPIHRITIDSYKKRYHIPLSYVLECDELRKRKKG